MKSQTGNLLSRAGSDAFFHREGTTLWGIEDELLTFLEKRLTKNMRTLETGVGASTVAFARAATEHVAISPEGNEFARVKSFCESQGISTERVTYHLGMSQDILPLLPRDPLDVVLIDGGHGFPIPFVDWLYTAERLRVHGIVVVDDTQIWTGSVLTSFLRGEYAWRSVARYGKAEVFEKLSSAVVSDWGGQPFVFSQSAIPKNWAWLGPLAAGLASQVEDLLLRIQSMQPSDAREVAAIARSVDRIIDSAGAASRVLNRV